MANASVNGVGEKLEGKTRPPVVTKHDDVESPVNRPRWLKWQKIGSAGPHALLGLL